MPPANAKPEEWVKFMYESMIDYPLKKIDYKFNTSNAVEKAEMLFVDPVRNYFNEMGCKLNGKSLLTFSDQLMLFDNKHGSSVRAFWLDFDLLKIQNGIIFADASTGLTTADIKLFEAAGFTFTGEINTLSGEAKAGLSTSLLGGGALGSMQEYSIHVTKGDFEYEVTLHVGSYGVEMYYEDGEITVGAADVLGVSQTVDVLEGLKLLLELGNKQNTLE